LLLAAFDGGVNAHANAFVLYLLSIIVGACICVMLWFLYHLSREARKKRPR